ncbi:MAG: DUF805 domain-containing protein [Methylobacterium mesophilicum]|nr:DUF805 domain-containing protein [Methylobacterium mesophilicum]
MNWTYLFTGFRGRVARLPFWAGLVLMGLVWLALGIVAVLGNLHLAFDPVHCALFASLALLSLWPVLAVLAKRWHDRDKSGWWSMLLLVPVIGPLWIFVELGMLEGTRGANQYGPDPLG